MIVLLLVFLVGAECGGVTESYKNQYCTDPRTMRKHAAYTEWADAYSCTRHRCQPGGRNLAIYTVGCKRVEAPESAIECEEVVEDTNMQFPFCCTRLRCLVVVRGEVWTRVLGQPWESLPAAPWSHMYKMKKPPPVDGTFAPKTPDQGPVYELTESDNEGPREKVLRASKSGSTDSPACSDPVPRAVPQPPPDIVIALSTGSDSKMKPLDTNLVDDNSGSGRHKRVHNEVPRANYFEDDKDTHMDNDGGDMDYPAPTTEKVLDLSDERFYGVTQKSQKVWKEMPQLQLWNEHDPGIETDSNRDNPYNQKDFPDQKSESDKPNNLQALVDAIGSRMRDIESVVQRMSEKVQQPEEETGDKGEVPDEPPSASKRHKSNSDIQEYGKTKKPDGNDHYKRFSVRNRISKYLYPSDSTTEKPLFVDDGNNNGGYFSDASNTVLRRSNGPKEPVQTYMAPVETRRRNSRPSETDEKKRKKHQHKKKKGKHHKKRRSKKRFNRLTSAEMDKNVISLEDSVEAGLKR